MTMTLRVWSSILRVSCRALFLGMMIALGSTSPAQAQAPDSSTQARELFQEARTAVQKGDVVGALVLFRKSQRLYPAPATLLNMASCEEQLGKTASAWQHYQEVLPQLPAGDDRLSIAQKGVTSLGPRVPRLQIRLAPGAPADTRVTSDEVEVAPSAFGTDLPVDPGKHVIAAVAPGRSERRYEVTVLEGQRKVVMVEPAGAVLPPADAPPAASEKAESPDLPPASFSSKRTAGYAVGGVGLAGLGLGGVFGILALLKHNEVDHLCPESTKCSVQGVEIANTGKAFAIASTAAFAVGLAGGGVGAYLLLSGKSAPNPSVSLAPVILPGGAGIGVGGSF